MISFHYNANSTTNFNEQLKKRQLILQKFRTQKTFKELLKTNFDINKISSCNCENLIGSIELPVGIAGPVKITGSDLNEEVLIPLATTEGALVASINRGCKAINESGAKVLTKKIGMSRAPVFQCKDGETALKFQNWIKNNWLKVCQITEATSSHLKLLDHESWIRGRQIFVRFVFDTDEAMGMNMVTIALQELWQKLSTELKNSDLNEIKMISLSSNVCCDKKDSFINKLKGRGIWAQAETLLSVKTVKEILKTTPQELIQTHTSKNLIGSNIAGSLSQNMQVANVAAAFFAATGQDLAHVVEASQAFTTLEMTGDEIYAAVTLPNINIGSLGGGTWLPAQTEARQLIRESQKINSQQLATVFAVAALAGELSGLASLANNTLAQAHQKLGRLK